MGQAKSGLACNYLVLYTQGALLSPLGDFLLWWPKDIPPLFLKFSKCHSQTNLLCICQTACCHHIHFNI